MTRYERITLPLILALLALSALAVLATGETAEDPPVARQSSFRWPGGPISS